MTVIGAQTVGRPVDQDLQQTEFKTLELPDSQLGGNNGGQTTPVSAADLSDALKEQEIYGPRTVNPLDSSAPDGSSGKGTTPANPDAPYILTAEPEARSSAIGNYLASLDSKPAFEDKQSWIGKETKILFKDNWVAIVDDKKETTTFYNENGKFVSEVNHKSGDIKYSDGSTYSGDTGDLLVPANKSNKYQNADDDTGGQGHSLPDIEGMLSGGKSSPSGDAMGLGQFKSGGVYDFKAMESKLENLLGIGTSSKGSGEQGGSTGVKTNTVSDGSSGGSSNDVKSAAPSGGGSVAPPTGLEALMQKFGMGDFGAHLKDGTFDLDNFSAGVPSAKGPVLDLDGNGQHDIIEWALGQIVSEKVEAAMVEDFVNNAGFTEFHQAMMDKYADMFIA